jgi:Na+-transporting methylmalonyl-CoA/oxaloacetate decarboxylase gamma subunit
LDDHAKETVMRLIGKLKEEVEKAETKEEKKVLIEEAGMELDDEELEQVAGGCIYFNYRDSIRPRGERYTF